MERMEKLDPAICALVDALCDCGVTYGESLREFKKRFLLKILRESGWNQCVAAERVGLHRNSIARQIAELGIEMPHSWKHRNHAVQQPAPMAMSAAAGR